MGSAFSSESGSSSVLTNNFLFVMVIIVAEQLKMNPKTPNIKIDGINVKRREGAITNIPRIPPTRTTAKRFFLLAK